MSIAESYRKAWVRATEGDTSQVEEIYDDKFQGFSHSAGKPITKKDVIQTAELFSGARLEQFRSVYENTEFACVQHLIEMHKVENRAAGKYSILIAISHKNGKIVSQETGMTLLQKTNHTNTSTD